MLKKIAQNFSWFTSALFGELIEILPENVVVRVAGALCCYGVLGACIALAGTVWGIVAWGLVSTLIIFNTVVYRKRRRG